MNGLDKSELAEQAAIHEQGAKVAPPARQAAKHKLGDKELLAEQPGIHERKADEKLAQQLAKRKERAAKEPTRDEDQEPVKRPKLTKMATSKTFAANEPSDEKMPKKTSIPSVSNAMSALVINRKRKATSQDETEDAGTFQSECYNNIIFLIYMSVSLFR
jgi:hypothetical protein